MNKEPVWLRALLLKIFRLHYLEQHYQQIISYEDLVYLHKLTEILRLD